MVRGTRAIDLDWGQGTRAPGGAGRGALLVSWRFLLRVTFLVSIPGARGTRATDHGPEKKNARPIKIGGLPMLTLFTVGAILQTWFS